MDNPSSPPDKPVDPHPAPHGGVDIQGGDVHVGHDVVAGDEYIAGDSISGRTVIIERGYSAKDVQRLILIVGGLVLITAAIFFTLGALAARPLVDALSHPLPNGSSVEAAATMGQKVQALRNLSPGQSFQVAFSEDEVSSYFRFVVGPAIDVSDGKARFLSDPGQIAIGGNADNFRGLPFVAQVNVTTGDEPFQLQGAWVKVLPTPAGSSIGYIPVTPLLRDLNTRLNELLFGQVQFNHVLQTGGGASPAIPGRTNSLVLTGVAK